MSSTDRRLERFAKSTPGRAIWHTADIARFIHGRLPQPLNGMIEATVSVTMFVGLLAVCAVMTPPQEWIDAASKS